MQIWRANVSLCVLLYANHQQYIASVRNHLHPAHTMNPHVIVKYYCNNIIFRVSMIGFGGSVMLIDPPWWPFLLCQISSGIRGQRKKLLIQLSGTDENWIITDCKEAIVKYALLLDQKLAVCVHTWGKFEQSMKNQPHFELLSAFAVQKYPISFATISTNILSEGSTQFIISFFDHI